MAGTPSPRCRNSILTADLESLTLEIIRGCGGRKKSREPDLKPLGPPNGPPKMAHFGRFRPFLHSFKTSYISTVLGSRSMKIKHAHWQSPCTCHYFYLESTPRHRGATVARRGHKCARTFFNLYTYKTFGLIYIYIHIQECVAATDQRSRYVKIPQLRLLISD